MMLTREAVIEVIAEEARIDPSRLMPEVKLLELNIDSIDIVSAMFALEEKFAVTVEPSEVARDGTVGDLVELILSHARR